MLVEAAILDRQHRFDEPWLNRTQRDRTPLLSFPCDEGGEYGRIERQALGWMQAELHARDVIGQPDGRPSFRWSAAVGQTLEGHLNELPPELRRPRDDRDGPAVDGELAGSFETRTLRVSEV